MQVWSQGVMPDSGWSSLLFDKIVFVSPTVSWDVTSRIAGDTTFVGDTLCLAPNCWTRSRLLDSHQLQWNSVQTAGLAQNSPDSSQSLESQPEGEIRSSRKLGIDWALPDPDPPSYTKSEKPTHPLPPPEQISAERFLQSSGSLPDVSSWTESLSNIVFSLWQSKLNWSQLRIPMILCRQLSLGNKHLSLATVQSVPVGHS